MALKKTVIEKIATLLKIKATDIEAAIASDVETDIVIDDDLQILTKAEQESRDRVKYGEGKKAGEEMLVDAIKKDNSVDVTGKDVKKVIEAIQKKALADANLTPDAQVLEAQKETERFKKAHKEANDKLTTLEAEREGMLNDNKLLGLFPADRSDVMNNEEYLGLIKSKIKIETREGKEVVIKDGEPILDPKTLQPIAPADALKGYFAERKWIKDAVVVDPKAGRGGSGSGPAGALPKFTKLSEVEKHVKESGLNPQGEAGTAMLQAAIKENPDMDMKS